MLTRISSFHNYQAVQNDFRRQESKIHHNQEQLASGKKLLSPADNPLATHFIQNVDQQEEQVRQYMDAIVLVRTRLERQEVLVKGSAEFADEAKRTVMEMINGSLSPEDRLAKRRELEELEKNLIGLANSQDESGNYVFSGTKAATQPFFRDKEGNVTYAGDDYQRKMKISNSLDIPFNNPGNEVFMEIKNPFGDYKPDYQLQEGSELLLENATNTDPSDDGVYKVTFVDMGNDQFGYQLDRNGWTVKTAEFDPKVGITYDGLTVNPKGHITAGDSIELSRRGTINIFDSFKTAMDYSDTSVSDASSAAKLQQATEELSAAYIHLSKNRTDIGARLNTLDIQEEQHQDFKISLAKTKSNFEDLDYAEAVIEFNENQRALQASQQAFGKTKDLTLFNYV